MAQLVLYKNVRTTPKKGSKRRRTMDNKNDDHMDFGMCFNNMNLSEMRKLLDKEGIGSLCKEMMGKMAKTEKGEWPCAGFMEQMMAKQSKKAEKEGRDEEQSAGDSREDRQRG
jgi:hypothetical protein